MSLTVQIQSFIVSFFYGFILSYFINLCYSWLFLSKRIFRIIFNFLFCISSLLLYFYFLYLINGGVVHIYFLILFLCGILIGNIFSRRSRIFKKKKEKSMQE